MIANEFENWAAVVAMTLAETFPPEVVGGDVEIRDIRAGFARLAVNPYRGIEEPVVRSRRATCDAIAAALGRAAKWRDGDIRMAQPVWIRAAKAAEARAEASPGDSRLAAIALTLRREADELTPDA